MAVICLTNIANKSRVHSAQGIHRWIVRTSHYEMAWSRHTALAQASICRRASHDFDVKQTWPRATAMSAIRSDRAFVEHRRTWLEQLQLCR